MITGPSEGDEVTSSVVAPEWFRTALDRRWRTSHTDLDGCRIAYRTWGRPDQPGIILVHGGAAHAGWWDHIAPWFAGDYFVVALDLSGHGDSGRRRLYDGSRWATEVLAVAAHAGIKGKPVVVGHSMGGWVTITAGAEHPGAIGGIVIIDTPVRKVSPEEEAATQRTAFGPLRVYRTKRMARARFRTTPEQPTSLPFVIEHVAAASLRQVEGGWTWKFDPAVFQWDRPRSEVLERVACRVALLRAERGLVTSDIGEQMYELLGRSAPVIEIPLAWHHIMLDQPIALITALRTLLADWEHSLPHRRALIQPAPESGT